MDSDSLPPVSGQTQSGGQCQYGSTVHRGHKLTLRCLIENVCSKSIDTYFGLDARGLLHHPTRQPPTDPSIGNWPVSLNHSALSAVHTTSLSSANHSAQCWLSPGESTMPTFRAECQPSRRATQQQMKGKGSHGKMMRQVARLRGRGHGAPIRSRRRL